MKNITTKLLVFSAFLFCTYLVPNTVQAQLPNGFYLDYYDHETPTIAKSGGWIVTCLYPEDNNPIWEQWWYSYNFSFSAQVKYNTGSVVSVRANMHSSGIEAYIPARPSNSNNYPTLIITVTNKQNGNVYKFSRQFHQL